MAKVFVNKRKVITTNSDVVTEDVVSEAVRLHLSKMVKGYVENEDMYLSDHDVLKLPKKDPWKPDNRLVFNYAKYIVDTFNGYQIGVPVKIKSDDDKVNQFVSDFRKVNDMEDSEFELAKMSSIFGHAFIYVYQDEEGITRATYNSPINMFIVHDNSIEERPLFAVRYTFNENENTGIGQVITNDEIIEAGLGVFLKTVEGYLTGINADRHLDKLTEDFAKLMNGDSSENNNLKLKSSTLSLRIVTVSSKSA